MQFDNVKTEVVDNLCEISSGRISHIQRHGPQFHHESILLFRRVADAIICGRFQVYLFTRLRFDRRVLEGRSWFVGSTLQGISARVVGSLGVDLGPSQDTEFANP